jgi:ATP-binding cassette subfamily B protein IrtA
VPGGPGARVRGYDTPVGERGARLSGGERQRLTLARAILADAPVIVLDEATAFTDPENEAAIQDAIGELVAGRTVIMIAHRLSTVVGADQILVIDDGRVVERGRHSDLLDAGGLYAELYRTQFEGHGRDSSPGRPFEPVALRPHRACLLADDGTAEEIDAVERF